MIFEERNMPRGPLNPGGAEGVIANPGERAEGVIAIIIFAIYCGKIF